MLRFREHRILEKRACALAIGIAGDDQHAFAGANVAGCLAWLSELGASLATFEMPLQVGIFEVRLAARGKGVREAENDEASALGGHEKGGAGGGGAGRWLSLASPSV